LFWLIVGEAVLKLVLTLPFRWGLSNLRLAENGSEMNVSERSEFRSFPIFGNAQIVLKRSVSTRRAKSAVAFP
jgi:hypothetical protein